MTTAAPGDDRVTPLLSAPVSARLVTSRALHGALLHVLLRLRGLLLLPVLARALGPSGMGVVTLGASICALLAPVLTLGVTLGASLTLSDQGKRQTLPRLFSTIAQFSIGSAAAGALLFLILLLSPLQQSALAPVVPYAAALAPWLFFSSLRELATVVPSLRQETGYLVRIHMLTEYGGALLAIAAAAAGFGPAAVFLAFGAGIALGAVPSLVRSWRLCGFVSGFDPASLRSALANGLPFLGIALGQWCLHSLDGLFLSALHGAAAVGVYGVAYTLASGALLVLAVLNFVYFPTAVGLLHQSRERLLSFFDRSFRLAALALGLLVAEACLLARWAVELLAGPPYRGAGEVVPLIVLAYSAFTYMQLLQFVPMVVQRRSSRVAMVYGPAVLSNVVLNALLIPRWALMGAAIATVASYLVAALLMGWLSSRAMPDFRCWRPLLRTAPVTLLSSGIALFLAVDHDAGIAPAALAAVTLAVVYLVLAWAGGALRADDLKSLMVAG